MEKIVYVFFVLIFLLISCSGNENSESDPNPIIKKITQISYEWSTKDKSKFYNMNNRFFYKDNKLKNIITEYLVKDDDLENRGGDIINWEIVYNNSIVTLNATFSGKHEINEESGKLKYTFILNSEGFVEEGFVSNEEELEKGTFKFEYTNSYLTSIREEEASFFTSGLGCDISYLDGNIFSISDISVDSDGAENFGLVNSIPSNIKNLTNICDPILLFIMDVVVSTSVGFDNNLDVLPLEILYQAGLLGKPTKNLTKTFTMNSGESVAFNYVLDNSNYLKEAILTDENSDEMIKWTYHFE